MSQYDVALGVIWLTFLVVWAATAFGAKRTLKWAWFRGWWVRLGVGIVIILVIRYNIRSGQGVSYLSGFVQNPALNLAGVVLAALGIALAVWARLHLGSNWGQPMSVKENPELVTSGPYAYIRNPIYTGVILAALGSSLVNRWWLILVVGSCAYFTYASLVEEKMMLKEFPDAYPAYKARTWRLIPFIF